MKEIIFFSFLFFSSTVFSQQTKKWGDQRDGTFVNPVIPADYSDIDVIKVGDNYYAISSTFQYSPGVVILHSKDLVNWQTIGHAVNDLTSISPELNWNKMNRYGKGIWAGAIRYHDDKFWIYFGTPDEGFFMTTATDPAGPWQPLHHVWNVKGWDDGCPFWDEDGQAYFVATNFADNYKIHLFKMSEDGKQLDLKSGSVIHQSTGSEANKLYKFNGMYYHFFSEVKTEGRVAMMERSKNIYGPYQSKQLNHVNPSVDKEPNQGGLVEDSSGGWWFFTHQGTGCWEGRAACLLPVSWIDGWPIIGKPGKDTIGNMIWNHAKPFATAASLNASVVDEFDNNFLAPQWEWNYQPRAGKWSLTESKGFLRLHAFIPVNKMDEKDKRKTLLRAGNTLTQRSMRTANNTVTIKIFIGAMENGQTAGLCHYSEKYSLLGIRQTNNIRRLLYDKDDHQTLGPVISNDTVWLRSTWNWNGKSQYSYSFDGKNFIEFGNTYQLSWGFYRGDRIGIFNYNSIEEKGYIDADQFQYSFTNIF